MGKSTSQYILLAFLAIAGIVGYLIYTKNLSSNSSASATSPSSTGGSSGGSSTGPSPAPPVGAGGTGAAGGSSGGSSQFPVTTSSPPSAIVAAFQQSGYFAQLSAEGLSSDITTATNGPSSWLSEHPYLYTYYPNYFAS